jgi:hypothetical protein
MWRRWWYFKSLIKPVGFDSGDGEKIVKQTTVILERNSLLQTTLFYATTLRRYDAMTLRRYDATTLTA